MPVNWELIALSPHKFWGGLQSPLKVPFCLLPVEGVRTSKILIVFLKIRKGLTSCVWSKNSFKFAVVFYVETAIYKYTDETSGESQPLKYWFQKCFTLYGYKSYCVFLNKS